MPESAQNYISSELHNHFRKLAGKTWATTLSVASAWIMLIVAPPFLRTAGVESAAASIYTIFSYACHQLPERSFHIFEHQFAVCSRCFGVYFGLLAGIAVYPIWRSIDEIEPLPRIWLILSIIPIGVDWSLTVFGIWENTHLSRFLTGAILGLACATFIVPALVETVRNLASKRKKAASAGGL